MTPARRSPVVLGLAAALLASAAAAQGSLTYRGAVHERQGGKNFGPTVEGARLTFTHEEGAPRLEARTDSRGRYSIDLPYGRYHVVVEARGFRPGGTQGGFVVVRAGGGGVYNVFLDRIPSGEEPTGAWREPGSDPDDWRYQEDQPPTVTLEAADYDLVDGDETTLTLTAADDRGLVMAWSGCRGCPIPEISGPRARVRPGETFTRAEWRFRPKHVGTYTFWANARDSAYPVKGEPHQASEGQGMAWVRIRVHPVGTDRRSWMGR